MLNNKNYNVKSPGVILRVGRTKYVDQLDSEYIEFNSLEASKYLSDKYGLTIKEYYDIVTNSGVGLKCTLCGDDLVFLSLSKGYSGIGRYCKKCHNKGIKTCVIDGKYDDQSYDIINYKGVDYKVISPGAILRLSKQSIVDQLSGDILIGNVESIQKHLTDLHGISVEDYYNIVVLKGIPEDRVCLDCGSKLRFRNLFDPYGEFCNKKCSTHYRTNTPESKEKYRNLVGNGIHSETGKLLAQKKSFISRSRKSTASLYIAYIGSNFDVIKIGITTHHNLVDRTTDLRNSFQYYSIHKLYYGDIESIAEYEYQIKLKFREHSLGLSNETFPYRLLNEIINFTKELVNSGH